MLTTLVSVSAAGVVASVAAVTARGLRRERRARVALDAAREARLEQPVSLHPVIDLTTCIGSGTCVSACPEGVLGRVDGLTHYLEPGECIGHGRCQAACPVDAISLVLGTAKRGVDIPLLYDDYETNVEGVFVAGELGGMGLIRNAMRQGIKAVEAVPGALARPHAKTTRRQDVHDVVIVGGGPAGVAAALACVEQGLSFVVLEQYTLGGSVTHYPRRKLVFSEEIQLPLVGRFGKREMRKEELIAELERALHAGGIKIQEGRRVTGMKGKLGSFRVSARRLDGEVERFRGRAVILALGRRGTPRKLDVPGEDLPHVVYRLLDPKQYRRRRVLCVGGGDSAVEAAVTLAGMAGCHVHLSYRGSSLSRCRAKNRQDLEEAVARGRVTLHLGTRVRRIRANSVTLRDEDGHKQRLPIDDVIVNIGGVLPTSFLESLGVEVETKRGETVAPSSSGRSTRRLPARTSARLGDAPCKGGISARAAGVSARLRARNLVEFAGSDLAWLLLGVCGGSIGPLILALGWSYYSLPLARRAGHALHDLLAPSRGLGLATGLTALLLILVNLTYVLRRRFAPFSRLLTIRTWINIHYVCGVTAASLALAHSALRTGNVIAVTGATTLLVAVVSGLFGRYVLVHLPRRADDQLANPAELSALIAQLAGDLRRKLKGHPTLQRLALRALPDFRNPPSRRRGLLALPGLVLSDLKAISRRRRALRLRDELALHAEGELGSLLDEVVELVSLHGQLERRLSSLEAVQDVLDSWRPLHLIMALTLITATALHVFLALRFSRLAF